ncbi:MAG TPA: ATP-binding protein [Candidatus Acidoferrales bacterium]|nr:ATP-binding protein [Candidatus Acidoferrales bacterium]
MTLKASTGYWRTGFEQPRSRGGKSVDSAAEAETGPPHGQASLNTGSSPARFGGSLLYRYGVSLGLVAVALIFSLLLQHLFPYPFLFLFFAAVMASAWFGGTSAGLFAVFASTIVVDYFFVPPYHSLALDSTDAAYFAGFVACALVASWVSSSQRKSKAALQEARDQLERRVAERTAELEKSNRDLLRTMREHDQAQQALQQTRSELAHLARALTMGELTSSIAHEINQPLTAVVAHGHACLEWLSADPPNVAKARQTVNSILRDGTRAGNVLSRIRALFSKQAHASDSVDMNEVISELTVFFSDDAVWQQVSVRTDLAPDLPRLKGDRIQLQQVVLNLMMNGMEAMRATPAGSKELVIRSRRTSPTEITISVEDSGVGLTPGIEEKVFEPFFTTKPQGIGMGLSISRSIVEAHRGRLTAAARPGGGAIFQFSLPIEGQN